MNRGDQGAGLRPEPVAQCVMGVMLKSQLEQAAGFLDRSVYHLGLELSDEGIRLGHFQAAYFFFFMIQIQTKLKIIYGLPFLSSNENA